MAGFFIDTGKKFSRAPITSFKITAAVFTISRKQSIPDTLLIKHNQDHFLNLIIQFHKYTLIAV